MKDSSDFETKMIGAKWLRLAQNDIDVVGDIAQHIQDRHWNRVSVFQRKKLVYIEEKAFPKKPEDDENPEASDAQNEQA